MVVISNSSDTEKIGNAYPQTEYLTDYDTDDLGFLALNKGKRINKKLTLNNIKLRTTAKLTDAISCSLGAGNDMLVSNKFYTLLKNFNCNHIQFFNVQFEYKKKVIDDYLWLHFIYDLEENINFKLTKYNNNIFSELKIKKFETYKQFKSFIEENDPYRQLRSVKTVLSKEFPENIDIFILSQIDQNIYISEKLYSEIDKNNISGLDFTKSELILI